MAVASLVLGILALVFCWTGWFGIISGVISLALGIVHLVKIKKSEAPKGKGLSIAGIVTGSIGLVVAVIVLIVITAAIGVTTEALEQASKELEAISKDFATSNPDELKSSYVVGEKATIDGFELTVTSVSDYTSTSEYDEPEKGNKYIKVDLVATNNGTENEYVSTFGFSCYADNYSVSSAYIYGVKELAGANLSNGKSTSGSLYYEVPINANSITLEYDYNIFRDQKIVFKLK